MFKVCSLCRRWFDIDSTDVIDCPSGACCDYCTDTTGRPHYKPMMFSLPVLVFYFEQFIEAHPIVSFAALFPVLFLVCCLG